MDTELYIYFLSDYEYKCKDKSKFQYKFNEKSTTEKFYIEFNKFVAMADSYFYNGNKYVTTINSMNVLLECKIIKHIINLYKYSKKIENLNYKCILADFLLTYYNTLLSNKSIDVTYKKEFKKFDDMMKKNISSRYYPMIYDECFEYYKDALSFGIKKNAYINMDVIEKILNNIREQNKRTEIARILIKKEMYREIAIEYDGDINSNKDLYLKHLYNIMKNMLGIKNVNNYLSKLESKKMLDEKSRKKIVNIYVNHTNDLCIKYKNKEESFINFLSEMENLRIAIFNSVNILTLNKKMKSKMQECLINLLSLKRYLLSDEDYVNRDMMKFSNSIEVDNKPINKMVNELCKNAYKLYNFSKINFDDVLENAIKNASNYPLSNMFNSFIIDTNNQTYKSHKENDVRIDNIIDYYEKIGNLYVKNNKKGLLNIPRGNYYKNQIDELHKNFEMHHNLSLSMIGKEKFWNTIKNLKKNLNFESDNDIVSIIRCILSTEYNLKTIVSKVGKQPAYYVQNDVDFLFKYYEKNDIARNGIMYIYFALYEKNGRKLRNNAMHGMLFGNDLTIPTFISFSCLIISSWLLNSLNKN